MRAGACEGTHVADLNPLELLLQAQRDLQDQIREQGRKLDDLRDSLHASSMETQRIAGDVREMRAGLGNYQNLRDSVTSLKTRAGLFGSAGGAVFGGLVAWAVKTFASSPGGMP